MPSNITPPLNSGAGYGTGVPTGGGGPSASTTGGTIGGVTIPTKSQCSSGWSPSLPWSQIQFSQICQQSGGGQ